MPEILCINLVDHGQALDDSDEETGIKTLTDIVPAEAETVTESIEVMPAIASETLEDGVTEAVDAVVDELSLYSKDLSGDGSVLAIGSDDGTYEHFGTFTNYAAKMLYQDISTAFAQRTITGITEATPGSTNPDAALAHYLTVAMISFVNRLSISEDEGVMTLDEAGE